MDVGVSRPGKYVAAYVEMLGGVERLCKQTKENKKTQGENGELLH